MTGKSFGYEGVSFGEAVFATGMTGYQETLTDPSYFGQVIIMTAPHIGITGVNSQDAESTRMWPAGFVVRDLSRRVSNWRSEGSLQAALQENKIVGIWGVDTRALTRHIRDKGAMRMGIFTGDHVSRDISELIAEVNSAPRMEGAHHTESVTTDRGYSVAPAGEQVAVCVAVDLGIKSMTPERMAERGILVHVVPASVSWEEISTYKPDGVFLSNGPGDPATADHAVELVQKALSEKMPVFGICFGHQILGRALGFDTYKLPFGHRGINQPVKDVTTGKVEITAHNHGFAVKAPDTDQFHTPFGRARVTHVCLNDGVVEGLELIDQPVFSVQYHPEAAAGPHDSAYLFDRFLEKMLNHA